jgi:hypothetical protein
LAPLSAPLGLDAKWRTRQVVHAGSFGRPSDVALFEVQDSESVIVMVARHLLEDDFH